MTQVKSKVWAALISSFLLETVSRLSSFFILMLSNQSLGLDRFGWTQLQLSTMEILQQCVIFGYTFLTFVGMKDSQDQKVKLRGLFSQIVTLRMVQASCCLLFFFTYYSYHQAIDIKLLSFFLFTTFAVAIDVNWFITYERKLPLFNSALSGFKVLQLLAIYYFIRGPEDAYLLLYLAALPNCLFNLGGFIYAYQKLGLELPNFQRCFSVFKSSLPFASVVLLGSLIDRIDIFTLNRFYPSELGSYSGASRLVQSLLGTMSVLIAPLHMEVSRSETSEKFVKNVQFSLWVLACLTFPLMMGGPFVSNFITGLILKNVGVHTPLYFAILITQSLGTILIFAFGYFVLMTKSKPWLLGLCYFLGIMAFGIAFLILKIFLAPGFALALAAVIGKISVGILSWYFSKSELADLDWRVFTNPLLASSLMAIVLWFSPKSSDLLTIIVGAVCYLTSLSALMWKDVKYLIETKILKRHNHQ